MANFLTQCPSCQTSFKVSEEQMQAANGVVRCGACMEVFLAGQHRITLKDKTPDANYDADSSSTSTHQEPEFGTTSSTSASAANVELDSPEEYPTAAESSFPQSPEFESARFAPNENTESEETLPEQDSKPFVKELLDEKTANTESFPEERSDHSKLSKETDADDIKASTSWDDFDSLSETKEETLDAHSTHAAKHFDLDSEEEFAEKPEKEPEKPNLKAPDTPPAHRERDENPEEMLGETHHENEITNKKTAREPAPKSTYIGIWHKGGAPKKQPPGFSAFLSPSAYSININSIDCELPEENIAEDSNLEHEEVSNTEANSIEQFESSDPDSAFDSLDSSASSLDNSLDSSLDNAPEDSTEQKNYPTAGVEQDAHNSDSDDSSIAPADLSGPELADSDTDANYDEKSDSTDINLINTEDAVQDETQVSTLDENTLLLLQQSPNDSPDEDATPEEETDFSLAEGAHHLEALDEDSFSVQENTETESDEESTELASTRDEFIPEQVQKQEELTADKAPSPSPSHHNHIPMLTPDMVANENIPLDKTAHTFDWSQPSQTIDAVKSEESFNAVNAHDKTVIHDNLSALRDEDTLAPLAPEKLAAIDNEPVELVARLTPLQTLKTPALLALSIMLLLAMAGQYFWFNLDRLSQDQRFDAITSHLCGFTSCPEITDVDLSALITEELIVRSHASQANALEVDFIFRNEASREQRFPQVELNFTNNSGATVANRVFTPEEYLPPEMHLFTHMPAHSSIQIKLELVDPGDDATGYSLLYRAL